ncbi:hypothetical protein AB0I84_50055 [Streptomyces spectabilis]|uniref:hypothetical protein n=1 Tax=Streptomyces spectabilis TaxID=68270 RepID=UPI0033C26D51
MDAPTRIAHCSASDTSLAAEASLTVALNSLHRILARLYGPLLTDASVQCAWKVTPVDVRQLAVHLPCWAFQTLSTGYVMGGGCWLGFPDGAGRPTEADRLGAVSGPGGPGLLAGAWG